MSSENEILPEAPSQFVNKGYFVFHNLYAYEYKALRLWWEKERSGRNFDISTFAEIRNSAVIQIW